MKDRPSVFKRETAIEHYQVRDEDDLCPDESTHDPLHYYQTLILMPELSTFPKILPITENHLKTGKDFANTSKKNLIYSVRHSCFVQQQKLNHREIIFYRTPIRSAYICLTIHGGSVVFSFTLCICWSGLEWHTSTCLPGGHVHLSWCQKRALRSFPSQ